LAQFLLVSWLASLKRASTFEESQLAFLNITMKKIHPTTMVMALLLLSLLLIPFLLNWNIFVLVFIFLGYSTFAIGYLFARQRNQKDLDEQQTELALDLVIRSMGGVVMIHRMEDHTNIFVSPQIKSILGYEPAYVLRKYTTFIVHPDDRKLLIPFLKIEILQQQPRFSLLVRVRKVDGDYISMQINGWGLTDDHTGLITHTVLSLNRAAEIATKGIPLSMEKRWKRQE